MPVREELNPSFDRGYDIDELSTKETAEDIKSKKAKRKGLDKPANTEKQLPR